MTEIKHVMGYLAFWDELRRRHPGLLIDSCASGRPPQRPGDSAPRRPAPAQRLPVRARSHHAQPGPHLRHLKLDSLLRLRLLLHRHLQRPQLHHAVLRLRRAPTRPPSAPTRSAAESPPSCSATITRSRPTASNPATGSPGNSTAPTSAAAWSRPSAATRTSRPRGCCASAASPPPRSMKSPISMEERRRRMSGKDLMEQGLAVEIKTKPGSAVIFYSR